MAKTMYFKRNHRQNVSIVFTPVTFFEYNKKRIPNMVTCKISNPL